MFVYVSMRVRVCACVYVFMCICICEKKIIPKNKKANDINFSHIDTVNIYKCNKKHAKQNGKIFSCDRILCIVFFFLYFVFVRASPS